jgi:transposase
MRFAYKYRLYPTKAQAEFLSAQLREACDLYNCARFVLLHKPLHDRIQKRGSPVHSLRWYAART